MKRARAQIAVLDDEEPVRRALERLLRSAGVGVDTFASGAEFFSRLSSLDPDCLILDLHMAGLNGFEVQARLKELNIALPVIVITGHDTPEARARAEAGGASAYLLKPVDEKALLSAISAAMASRTNP